MASSILKPAAELARASGIRFPNESAEYRRAREALLAEEIELRRHIERVAELRRALPPGGEVKKNYAVRRRERQGVASPICSATSRRSSIYSYMFGPQRERPCPMCTSFYGPWDGEAAGHRAAHRARVRGALADRAVDRGQEGARLDAAQLYSDISGDYTRD